MAAYQVSLNKELLANLLGDGEGLKRLLESALNQVLEAELTEHIGAERYERREGRTTQRNGFRERTLYTRVGPLNLRVPQTRDGSFCTEIFARFQRSEQAFVLALMEMYVNGVSTRKVSGITEALCGASFAKSTVSQLCTALDARVKAFNDRRLEGLHYPFLVVDALYTKARQTGAVQRLALLVVSGINAEGNREILGVAEGDSEAESFWRETFRKLKSRGLSGVDYVVSDDHQGIVNSVAKEFIGASWQRCQVHLMRNVLSYTPPAAKLEMAQALKSVFACERADHARQRANELLQQFESRASKACRCLENGLEDSLQVMALPEKYRRRLKSTNMQERLIEEIRRRERVIRIFPNPESAIRLVGSLLAEQHEAWQERKYFDMADYWTWRQQREASHVKEPKVVTLS